MSDLREDSPADRRILASRLRRHTALSWVWVFAMFTIWSMATPPWGSPDATSHELMAYHAVRDITPENTTEFANSGTANAIGMVPRGLLESASSVSCYAFDPAKSAGCLTPVGDDTTLSEYVNSAGRYIPTYYLLTGWPSLFVPLDWVTLSGRAAASAVAAFFVAWGVSAFSVGLRRRSVALTGIVASLTPMVAFLGGALSPNTLEIATAIALAATSVVFLREGGDTWLGRAMFRRMMVAAALLCAIRMLAPVWALVWALTFVLLAGRRHWSHVFSRRGLWWAGLPVLACLANVVWTFTSGLTEFQAEPQHDLGWWKRLELAKLHQDQTSVLHQIGNFGWLDTGLSPGSYHLYQLCALTLVAICLATLSKRQVIAIVFLAAAQYFLPIFLEAAQWNTNGPVWQGRYTLPMTVMVPVMTLGLAATRINRRNTRVLIDKLPWAFPLLTAGLLIVHVQAYIVQLRRNIDGHTGSLWATDGWMPPIGTLPAMIGQWVLLAILLALVVRWYVNDFRVLDQPSLGAPARQRRGSSTHLRSGRHAREPMADDLLGTEA